MRLLGVLLLSVLEWSAAWAAPEAKDYRLNPGDVIEVSVWREDDLRQELRVLPDGSITFPLVGRIEVAGLQVSDVARVIAEKLEQYIPEPNVSVVIAGIEGNVVYVLGKVLKPGPVVMSGPLTVLQVLSLAGGLDKFADEDAIKVVRNRGGAQETLLIAYADLIAARDMSTNMQLQAGDTLVVP